MQRIKVNKDNFIDIMIEFLQCFKPGKEYVFTMEEYSEDRSTEANAYMWVLLGKMARVLKTSKEDLYKEYLRNYGVSFLLTVPTSRVGEVRRKYKYVEEFLPYYIEDPNTTCLEVIIGSSEYSKKDFSELLDGVIEGAKTLGIDTDPEEVRQIMERYTDECK